MQGSMGKAVCDRVIRDSIKMYPHKGAQLRLHGQRYSFSFSFFYSAWFFATYMVLYPFIYNFIGCLKKIQKGREKKAWKSIVWHGSDTEIQGWHFMVHSRGFGHVNGRSNGRVCRWSRMKEGWAGMHAAFPGILQHRAPCILALPLRSIIGGLLLLSTTKAFLSRSSLPLPVLALCQYFCKCTP